MAAYPLRWAPLVAVGLVSGLAQVVIGVVMYLTGVYFEPWVIPFFTLLLAVSIALGNWWYGKHVLGGHTTYPKALLAGIVISVSSALVYITYNVVSVSLVYPHFLEDMIQAEFARASVGMDAQGAAQLLDSLRTQVSLRNLVMGNLMAESRIGTLLSVPISIGFLARWRRVPKVAEERV